MFISTQNKLSYEPNVESSDDQQKLEYFKMTGRLVARAIIAGVSVPAYFSQGILKCILKRNLTLKDLKYVDKRLYNSLMFLMDNDADECDVTFERTIQGSKQIYTKPLKKDGENILVTNENKEEYIQLMINDVLYNEAKQQINAIVTDFHVIILSSELCKFNLLENHFTKNKFVRCLNFIRH